MGKKVRAGAGSACGAQEQGELGTRQRQDNFQNVNRLRFI